MRFYSRAIIAGASSLLLMLGAAEAKPGKGKGKGNQGVGGPPSHAKVGKAKGANKIKGPKQGGELEIPHIPDPKRGDIPRFDDHHRRRIVDYFAGHRGHPHGLPPGLAKKLRSGKPLPPGWQKKLSAGWVIDHGWWPRFQPLPYSWFPDLPMVPDTGLYLYGDRVMRVYEPRRQILDVIVVPTIHISP